MTTGILQQVYGKTPTHANFSCSIETSLTAPFFTSPFLLMNTFMPIISVPDEEDRDC
jgi:hypothetical protein